MQSSGSTSPSNPDNPAQSKYLPANGIRHHYLDWGNDAAPPLIMSHGAGHCAQIWSYIAGFLASDFHVMSFDQRGHGNSEAPGPPYTFRLLAQDLVAIIAVLEVAPVGFVGHSSGGLAALLAQSIQPNCIGRGVLVEAVIQRSDRSPGDPPNEDSGRGLAEVAERTRQRRTIWESREAMYQTLSQRGAFQSWHPTVLRDFVEGCTRPLTDGRVQLKCDPDVEARYYEDRETLDLLPSLPGLTGQLLLMLGEYSGPQSQNKDSAGVRKFLEVVPGARVKFMGYGTHFLPMEYPDLVLPEIRSFLSGEND